MLPSSLRVYGALLTCISGSLVQGSTLCPTQLIHEFPHNTWIENIAVRRDGSLLLTSLRGLRGLTSLDPNDGAKPHVVVDTFPGVNGTLGIIETVPDVFYVIGSNFILAPSTPRPQQGTNAIFEVDFNTCDESGQPSVKVLARMTDAIELNGFTKFNDTLLLAGDSGLGAVWAVDTQTGSFQILVQDALLLPDPPTAGLGINGLHYRAQTRELYFTNYAKRTFGRIQLGPDATLQSPISIITKSFDESDMKISWDDFALDRFGGAYIATGAGHSIQMVTPDGKISVLAGNVNSTAIAEPTAAQFGRTRRDRDVLYVTTAGGILAPVYQNGEAIRVGGQVVAVDVAKCRHHSMRHGGWRDGRLSATGGQFAMCRVECRLFDGNFKWPNGRTTPDVDNGTIVMQKILGNAFQRSEYPSDDSSYGMLAASTSRGWISATAYSPAIVNDTADQAILLHNFVSQKQMSDLIKGIDCFQP
nr:hypothetical protein CFP56_69146 [Quercus suber]